MKMPSYNVILTLIFLQRRPVARCHHTTSTYRNTSTASLRRRIGALKHLLCFYCSLASYLSCTYHLPMLLLKAWPVVRIDVAAWFCPARAVLVMLLAAAPARPPMLKCDSPPMPPGWATRTDTLAWFRWKPSLADSTTLPADDGAPPPPPPP